MNRHLSVLAAACACSAFSSSLVADGPSDPVTIENPHPMVARPDAHAPLGVMFDHAHGKGEIMLGYRYFFMRDEGLLRGDEAISSRDVFRTENPGGGFSADMSNSMANPPFSDFGSCSIGEYRKGRPFVTTCKTFAMGEKRTPRLYRPGSNGSMSSTDKSSLVSRCVPACRQAASGFSAPQRIVGIIAMTVNICRIGSSRPPRFRSCARVSL
jgi:hypothetical protein